MRPKEIVAKENNREFRVAVSPCSDADLIHIDTAECETGIKRCDYAIRVTPSRKQYFYYIELKGTHVLKAAEQLTATITRNRSIYAGYAHKEAWVISSGWCPAVFTRFQRFQNILKKECGFDLKHETKKHKISLEDKGL